MSNNFFVLIFFLIKFFSYFVYLSRYEADENGNRASFKFGTGVANGDNRSSSSSKSENGRGDKNGRSSYLSPTKKDVDRSYLPPQ